MSDLPKGSFAAQIGAFRVGSLQAADRVRRAITLKLFGAIIMDTPVDTGRLRGNWRTAVAAPNLVTTDNTAVGVAQAELQANLGDGVGKDVTVFCANNLPYAYRIEYEGWSHTKAPEGMVRRNVARISNLVKQAVAEGRL